MEIADPIGPWFIKSTRKSMFFVNSQKHREYNGSYFFENREERKKEPKKSNHVDLPTIICSVVVVNGIIQYM